MDGDIRALRFCPQCGQWVDAWSEHRCPMVLVSAIRAAQQRLEAWLGDFTIYQHDHD